MSYSDYVFGKPLREIDPEIARIIEYEEERQARKIILIPSESICPAPVLEALGTAFNNVYAEGYPSSMMIDEDEATLLDLDFQLTRYRRYSDRRFYKGCEYANFLETLAGRRAAVLFSTEKNPPENIHVNVQPLSGSTANSAVYDAFVEPGETVMGLSLMHGGHLTHGSEFNRSGKNYRIVSYEVNSHTGKLDYIQIAQLAEECRPKMIIAGYTSYPWAPDWKKFREIADNVGAVLCADISHPAGLVVAGVYPNPIDYADVTTCTTHKTFFGPRGAIIMTTKQEYAERIDQAIFPGEQGGPHVNKFAAMAVAFKIARSEEFKEIQRTIVENAAYFGRVLIDNGLKLAYGGTDTHIVLLDLNSIPTKSGFPLKGEIAVRVLDLVGIVTNKNTIPGDTVTAEASGVRMGTPWITQRGITRKGFKELGSIIALVVKNINPFTYIGFTGDLPRGKIDYAILQEAKKRVDSLAGGLHFEKHGLAHGLANGPVLGYPHFGISSQQSGYKEPDFQDRGVMKVEGKRSVQFLEGLSTRKTTDMNVGDLISTFFLDKTGALIAPVLLYRLQPDGETDQFLIICEMEAKERLLVWLRGLSDGYAVFDDEDIFKKIDGPVIVLGINEMPEEERSAVRTTLENISSAPLEIPHFSSQTGSKALFHSHPEYFTLSKPYFIGQRTLPEYGELSNDVQKEVFSFVPKGGEPKKSCLYNEHLKLSASMVNFAGWNMPVRYESTIEEHRAVREKAGIFDITHMGILEVAGKCATQFLDSISSNYVPWIKDGESQYSYLLDIEGNVIDDIMIYRQSGEKYLVVVNAVNSDIDFEWMKAVNSKKVIIDRDDRVKEILSEVTIRYAKNDPGPAGILLVDIALQGPESLTILREITPSATERSRLDRLEKSRFIQTALGGIDVIVSRTGYTGEEIGYELFLDPARSSQFWSLILDAGRKFGVQPVGLGARDSLRIEAGLPLWGHELAGPLHLSPIEAGFGAYVKFHKTFFIGRNALLKKMKSFNRSVVRFQMHSRGVRIAKPDDLVVSSRTQRIIGRVTSCAVDKDGLQVGMALVDTRFTREGLPLCIVPGAQAGKEKSKLMQELGVGDRFPLHSDAVVLSRFIDGE